MQLAWLPVTNSHLTLLRNSTQEVQCRTMLCFLRSVFQQTKDGQLKEGHYIYPKNSDAFKNTRYFSSAVIVLASDRAISEVRPHIAFKPFPFFLLEQFSLCFIASPISGTDMTSPLLYCHYSLALTSCT